MNQLDPFAEGPESLPGSFESGGIQVEGDQAPIRRGALEDRRRVLASPHGSVDHQRIGSECQKGKSLVQKHGPVREFRGHSSGSSPVSPTRLWTAEGRGCQGAPGRVGSWERFVPPSNSPSPRLNAPGTP